MLRRSILKLASKLAQRKAATSLSDVPPVALFHGSSRTTPSRSEVRVGVIGCGRIGQFHAKTVTEMRGSILSWMMDSQFDAASELIKELQTELLPADLLASALRSTPADPHYVDAVIVCAPTQFHPFYVETCLDLQKPVLCEKPLTADPQKLNALFDLAKEKNTQLRIGYQRVFDLDIAKLIDETHSHSQKEKVSPWSISMRSYDSPTAPAEYLRSCGSVFVDAMCHDFHVAASLLPFNDSLATAFATEAPFLDESMGARSAMAVFRTKNNTLITSEFHRVSHLGYDNTIDLTFPEKMFRLQSRPRFRILQGEGTGMMSSADFDTGFITKYEHAYKEEVAAFLESVAEDALLDDAHMRTCISAMWMARMAMDASKSGKEVFFRDYDT